MPGDYAFDPFSDEVLERGPEAFAELARHTPTYRYRGRFDFFIESDPEYVTERILKDAALWTAEQGFAPTSVPPGWKPRVMREDVQHTQYRVTIQRGFSPTELLRLRGLVEEIADDLIAKMLAIPEHEGDFFQLFAMPLPARLMCRMLGAPEERYEYYKNWADGFFYESNNDPNPSLDVVARRAEVTASLFELVRARRAEMETRGLAPDHRLIGTELPNDFISRALCANFDGEYFADVDITSIMTSIILGGNETTMNLIGNLLWRLLGDHRALWERLKADPALIEPAIEESLRLDPPVQGQCRVPREDVDRNGVVIPAGHKVFFNVSAINRDPAVWDDPEEFRLDRPPAQARRHGSFGGGIHMCLGMNLVRMEVKLAFEKLLKAFPNLRIAGETRRSPGFSIWGKNRLPVAW